MRKNKKYISDVQNKIVELHKIESSCKKRAKALKIPISTIRAIIKRFQSTKNVTNLPERGRVSISSQCTVRRRVSVAKDSPRTTAGELQRLVESWGQKPKKIYTSNIPYITTCCSGGFQEKLSSLIQKQTPANSVVRHDWNFKWHWLLLSDETEKRAFWQQTHQMSLVQTGIKKYPMTTVKYTAGSLMLWACFSAGGPGYLVQMHGIMDSIKYQKIKNSKPDCLCKKSYHGQWLDLQSGQ